MSPSTEDRFDAPADERPSVLVVDDERQVADLYTTFLEDEYDVTTVYSGPAAVEALDGAFDVVLLDRQMPAMSGDAVLDEIANRKLDTMVAMVTAIDPEFDIIDMPFHDYVTKPVSAEDLRATVERLLQMAELKAVEYELSSLRVKRNVLDAEARHGPLADDDEFARLQGRIEELRYRLRELREELDAHAPTVPGVA